MNLEVGCNFAHRSAGPTPAIALVEPHSSLGDVITGERWDGPPAERYDDLYGNRSRRLILPEGNSTFAFHATVEVSDGPDEVPGAMDVQHRIEDLSSELLHWLLPSRLCESDQLGDRAWALFSAAPPGVERVQAVCDWVHDSIEYGVASIPTTTMSDVLARGGGMCRDFAHLGVGFCRALGIPARYVFGYLPDIGIPGPYPVMDFHAWFEVWLGQRWWTYDARFNTPRIGRVAIGRGRDAVDVAMVTTYGDASLAQMTVWADEVVVHASAATRGGTA